MSTYTVIPQDTFDNLQMDAGVLLSTFNPASPAAPADADIITATTGGINIICQPTYSDLGEDVDNCPNNMKELKHLDSWACTLSTTALGTSAELIRWSLGAADVSGATYAASSDTTVKSGKTYYTRTGAGTAQSPYVYTPVATPTGNPSTSNYYEMTQPNYVITPRKDLDQNDFADLWWVGDKAGGGLVAVKLINALSTGGFNLQTTKNGKGQLQLELTGHVSIDAQSVMPMEFYSIDD